MRTEIKSDSECSSFSIHIHLEEHEIIELLRGKRKQEYLVEPYCVTIYVDG